MKGQQLPLSVQLRETASFDSFFAGPNAATVEALQALSAGGPGSVLLFGATGAGKTHLLQALARAAQARGLRGAYLPLGSFLAQGPQALDGYERVDLLCLDELDAVCADIDWALALLRLIDQLRATNAGFAIAAMTPPDRMQIALPDLRTRLAASAVQGLKPLTDADRSRLLRERAQARGLDLSEEVSRWLLTRLERDAASLLAALETLDRASLSAQRRLTLPFVQGALADAGAQTAPG